MERGKGLLLILPLAGWIAPAVAAPERMPTKKEEQDIVSTFRLMEQIPDGAAAVKFLEELRWGKQLSCAHCGSHDAFRSDWAKRQTHWCPDCRMYFSVKTGTVMAQTQLALRNWIMAIHLVLTTRKGISSIQISKQIGCTQKTAWFLMHRIREAMQQGGDKWLSSVVEVDETFTSGKERNKRKTPPSVPFWGKMPVMGLREQSGRIVAFPMPMMDNVRMRQAILNNVANGSSIYTDGHTAYLSLSSHGYNHESVNHNAGEYVRDQVTTNGVESFWALLKRGYVGVYHYMSWDHLFRYVNEFTYRYNSGPGNGFQAISGTFNRMEGHRLSYKQLKTIGAIRREAEEIQRVAMRNRRRLGVAL